MEASGQAQRCFIYHNTMRALEWIESQRVLMRDPSKRDYFLQYPNGSVINEPIVYGDQFLWNFTNPRASQAYIDAVLSSVADEAVDGSYTDDVLGASDNITTRDGVRIVTPGLRAATAATQARLVTALIAAGRYNWQAFPSAKTGGGSVGDQTAGGVPSAPDACVRFMRRLCDPKMQARPMLMSGTANDTGQRPSELGPASNQSVAAFLITRPPIAYIGWGWESGLTYDKWSDLFLLQPGTPAALCEEKPRGVFSRRWSAGTARLDCARWEAELPFPSLGAAANKG